MIIYHHLQQNETEKVCALRCKKPRSDCTNVDDTYTKDEMYFERKSPGNDRNFRSGGFVYLPITRNCKEI